MLKGAQNWSWNENGLILVDYLILRTEHANRMQDEHWCLQQFLATVLFFIKVAVGGGSGGGGTGLGATWYLGTWIISLCITSHLAGQMSAGLGWAMDLLQNL